MNSIDEECSVVIERLLRLSTPEGRIKIGVVQKFVSECAWWYAHPKGPVKAPEHYKRLEASASGWELPFGANTFLASKAIERSIGHLLRDVLPTISHTKQKIQLDELRSRVSMIVRGSVLNFNRAEFDCYGDAWDEHLHFGAQSISLHDFYMCLHRLGELHRITE